jgi:hypothetical protein
VTLSERLQALLFTSNVKREVGTVRANIVAFPASEAGLSAAEEKAALAGFNAGKYYLPAYFASH